MRGAERASGWLTLGSLDITKRDRGSRAHHRLSRALSSTRNDDGRAPPLAASGDAHLHAKITMRHHQNTLRHLRAVPTLTSGTHNVLFGSVSLRETLAMARLAFILTANGTAVRSALLLRGQPDERTQHDLAVLQRLLLASGRRIESCDLSGLLRAVSGLRARVKLRVLPSGFAVIEEVVA
jgi:hypothetical protein